MIQAATDGRTTFTTPSDVEIVQTREFDAPRDLVYKVYTDPTLIPRWWGPSYLTTTVERMDVRPGGSWRFVQRASDGTIHAFNGVYRDVVPPERLVSTFEYEPWAGHIIVTTTTFDALAGDRTRLTVVSLFSSKADRDNMLGTDAKSGAIEGMNRLEDVLAHEMSGPDLVLTRIFDAPRELVFKAFTEPEHLVQWWGPMGFTTPHCTVDARLGGGWHMCMRAPEGNEVWFKGVFREFQPPERIVVTDHFVDEAGNPVGAAYYGLEVAGLEVAGLPDEGVITIDFVERDGKTTLTLQQSIPAAVAESHGESQGWQQSFDRLAAYLATH